MMKWLILSGFIVMAVLLIVVQDYYVDDLFPIPKWGIGTCIITTFENRERWESQYIYRIEEVGKKSYRTSSWVGDHWTAPDNLSSDGFENQSRRAVYPCPK